MVSQGVLLIGFTKDQGEAATAWLHKMEPNFPVSYCTLNLLRLKVRDALLLGEDSPQLRVEAYEPVQEVLPRLALLSGVSGEEAIAIAEHWEEFTGAWQQHISMSKLMQRKTGC